MTPDEAEAALRAAVWEVAPAAQAGWALILDVLEGHVAEAMSRGWTEEQARQLVCGQFLANLQG